MKEQYRKNIIELVEGIASEDILRYINIVVEDIVKSDKNFKKIKENVE